jgi:hypothetical protein
VVGSVRWAYVVLMMSVDVVDNGELHKLWGLLFCQGERSTPLVDLCRKCTKRYIRALHRASTLHVQYLL